MGNKNVHAAEMHKSQSSDSTISELSTAITSRHSKANTSSANLSSTYLPICNTPSPATTTSPPLNVHHKRRRSSLLIVHNGITGKFISSRICKIAAKFWKKHVDSLSVSEQLEIGCSIFFGMMSTCDKTRKFMKANISTNNTIETTSLKYLDMFGWLIRHLTTDNIDLYSLLYKLGVMHQKMGITIDYFAEMLKAMHDTFAYYFEDKYNIEIKYAMDEIFTLAAQFMTGEELKCAAHLMDLTKQFQQENVPFLKNLATCLKSSIGKEYLYRYLSQTWCEEIVIFLQSVNKFKRAMNEKERFFIARGVVTSSIEQEATFALNLSYDTRTETMYNMAQLESKFAAQETFVVSNVFFDEVEREVLRLIMANHWLRFVENIQTLQSKSFEIQ